MKKDQPDVSPAQPKELAKVTNPTPQDASTENPLQKALPLTKSDSNLPELSPAQGEEKKNVRHESQEESKKSPAIGSVVEETEKNKIPFDRESRGSPLSEADTQTPDSTPVSNPWDRSSPSHSVVADPIEKIMAQEQEKKTSEKKNSLRNSECDVFDPDFQGTIVEVIQEKVVLVVHVYLDEPSLEVRKVDMSNFCTEGNFDLYPSADETSHYELTQSGIMSLPTDKTKRSLKVVAVAKGGFGNTTTTILCPSISSDETSQGSIKIFVHLKSGVPDSMKLSATCRVIKGSFK